MIFDLHGHEFSLAVSVAIGALHALEPGHGKSALVAHLLTEKRSILKPGLIASTTAITHAASIFLTAMIAHGILHAAIDTDSAVTGIYQYLNIASGLVLLLTAFYLFWRTRRKTKFTLHSEGASCSCGHRHSLLAPHPKTQGSWRTIALGFAAGLVPCPSALVALSSAITTHNWITAVILVSAFSLGIFIALMSLGLLLGFQGQKFTKRFLSSTKNPQLAFQLQGVVIAMTGVWHLWTGLF